MKKLLLLILLPLQLLAQNISFKSFKDYTFTKEICSSAQGSKIAWVVEVEGKRNIYVASGPDFTPIKLTGFSKDDGQEITSLSISDDGKWVVFVRGGDHGGNYDDNVAVNPASDLQPFKVQVATIPFIGGKVKYLSEGDLPVVSVKNRIVAFIKDKQAWFAPLDGTAAAKNLFTTRGEVNSLQWSPDEKSLLFVTNRTDHAIVGIYDYVSKTIKWVAPSFNTDATPCWSPDGNKIAFIRMPGTGGAPDSLLVNQLSPWSIYTAEVASGKAALLWKAPATLRGGFPQTDDQTNLYWAANNKVVFLSYHDGWQHLYSIPASGGKETLLTPGNFMVDHVVLSADKKYLTFGVNTGNDDLDIERRHAAKVSVDKADMQVITQGTGLEWDPVLTGDGNTLAVISATAQRPPLAAVLNLKNNDKAKIKILGNDLIPADFPQNKYVTPKQVVFKSPDGTSIHADLFEPTDGAAKHPAIVFVHGGPPRQMLLGWHYFDYYASAYASNQYLANLGFVVLSVNYRLGIGYGYEFNQPQNAGPAGAAEYQDIKAAGEWLQNQSFVDASKIGIYGGSYGGYLTAMALAHDSKIFAAGVDIHGVHDWVSLTSMLTAYTGKYEKAPDFDKAVQTAWQSSPVSAIDTWQSPVLIIHGDDDRNVPFNQSVDLIRRLEKKGVPYETLMIVNDTHHWMGFDNSVKVYGAVADFFVKQFKK
jgi:dipeptidyl aminopeptidase/acylaminoacyl peptidase